jgi:hypothetical protein
MEILRQIPDPCKNLLNRVITPGMKRMAAPKTPEDLQQPLDDSVLDDSLAGIF